MVSQSMGKFQSFDLFAFGQTALNGFIQSGTMKSPLRWG